MWIAWIALSNIGIMWLEYVYRSGRYENFVVAIPYIVLPIVVAQIGLFYGFRYAPNLLLGAATFTLINTILRVANTHILGEYLNWMNWLGVVCLLTGTLLLKVK